MCKGLMVRNRKYLQVGVESLVYIVLFTPIQNYLEIPCVQNLVYLQSEPKYNPIILL